MDDTSFVSFWFLEQVGCSSWAWGHGPGLHEGVTQRAELVRDTTASIDHCVVRRKHMFAPDRH